MRVTHVITRLIVGGAQENTVCSVLGLRQKPGLEVSLIAGPSSGPEGSLEQSFNQTPGVLQIIPDLVRPVRPWRDMKAFFELTRLIRVQGPTIVHTHSGKAGVLGRLAASRAGVPIIVHTIHGPSFGPFQGPAANALFGGAEKLAGRVTTHFVVVADAMSRQYLTKGIGRPEQYTKILSGFDLGPFLCAGNDTDKRARLGIAPDDIVIGKIARLTSLKGHGDLLQAARELIKSHPKIRFLLLGDGNLRPDIEARVRALGLQHHFIFTGLIRPEKVAAFIGIMDVLVHLSTREGLARALPQAMACSKPVVAYDSDGAAEVCIDNQTGFLIPAGKVEKLVDRLQLLASDHTLRSRLGSNGRELVVSRFGAQKMVDDLHALYLRLGSK